MCYVLMRNFHTNTTINCQKTKDVDEDKLFLCGIDTSIQKPNYLRNVPNMRAICILQNLQCQHIISMLALPCNIGRTICKMMNAGPDC